MKHKFLVLVILLGALLLVIYQPAAAQGAEDAEPYTGTAICLPEAYLDYTTDCLPLGPSQTLTEMARNGMTYPPRPLPAIAPDPAMSIIPVNIAQVHVEETIPAYIYGSLDDAVAGNNPTRQINPGWGLKFVSYIQRTDVNGNAFVMLKSGEWMRASPAGYSPFQGLLFSKTPSTMFGWMFDQARARSAPSYDAPEVGELRNRYSIIQIYQVVEAEGMEWFMVGPNQWVPWQKARRVRVDTTPPNGVTGDRWISVNLYDQTISVYENRQLIFATMISSGADPLFTRPGLFQIKEKKELETMSGAFESGAADFYYLEDVPWTMYFDQARALHGAYWRPWFGYPDTHGCVNLSIGDSNWLFHWANEGDWVYVWDPSGKTPTDPSLYSEGGA